MSDLLTTLMEARALVKRPQDEIIGIAVSPADLQALRDATPVHAECLPGGLTQTIAGIPYLVDPRVARGKVETYRDEESWGKRRHNQSLFDEGLLGDSEEERKQWRAGDLLELNNDQFHFRVWFLCFADGGWTIVANVAKSFRDGTPLGVGRFVAEMFRKVHE